MGARRAGRMAFGLLMTCLLAACDAPAAVPAAGAAEAKGALSIAELSLDAAALTVGERFTATFRIGEAGSRLVVAYGLSTEQGRQVFQLTRALPIIDRGRVEMLVGPLPNVRKTGPTRFEFWLVDSAGAESNHLSGELRFQ